VFEQPCELAVARLKRWAKNLHAAAAGGGAVERARIGLDAAPSDLESRQAFCHVGIRADPPAGSKPRHGAPKKFLPP